MTLVEVMIVIIIMAIMTAGIVAGSGGTAASRLKRSSTMLSGAIRIAMTRASITGKSQRLVFDLDESKLWLEEASQPMLVSSIDKSASAGADPVTEAEQKAQKEAERILKGPEIAKPRFTAVSGIGATSSDGTKGPRSLERDIKFKSVETLHDTEARTSGRAYLYFWPGGQTERAAIILRIGDAPDDERAMSLLVSPLTGKVTVKGGSTQLVRPTDEKDMSEREDTGGGL
jgi:general secretion pathway protein H